MTRKTTIPAFYTMQLADKIGPIKAAEALGIKPSSISTIRARGECSMPVEFLARRICEQSDNPTDRVELWFMRVPPAHREMLTTLFTSLNIRFSSFRD